MSVVVGVEDVGPCRKQLKIEVPEPAVKAETRRVVSEYQKEIRLPGFRKGKIPPAIVLKRFRREVEQEVVQRLVPRYWKQAEAESSLNPLIEPEIGDIEINDGEPFVFSATVEVRPDIELSENRDYELPEAEVLVGEAEVEEALEQLRMQLSTFSTVERDAANGDQIKARIRELSDGHDHDDHHHHEDEKGDGDDASREASEDEPAHEHTPREPQEVTFEIGDAGVWEELSLAVTGLSAGQTTRFEREHQAGAEGEHTHRHEYEIEILEVQERELPELDDELAKKIGDFSGFDELREQIEDRVRFDKQQKRRQERRQALLDQLIERHPFELPKGVVEHESRSMLTEYAETLQRQGVDLERAGIDWQALGEQTGPEAAKRVHSRLVLDAMAEADEVGVSEEEIEDALRPVADANNQSTMAIRKALDESGRLRGLREQLRRDKVLRALLGEEDSEGADDETDSDGDASASEDESEEK